MNRLEHLLTIAAEECAEIAQRLSKAQRFGLNEVQPGQELNNAERVRREFVDLLATLEMVEDEDAATGTDLLTVVDGEMAAKKAKVEEFLELSRKCGTLSD